MFPAHPTRGVLFLSDNQPPFLTSLHAGSSAAYLPTLIDVPHCMIEIVCYLVGPNIFVAKTIFTETANPALRRRTT